MNIIFSHCIYLLEYYQCFCCSFCCSWRFFTLFFESNNEMGLESMPFIEYAYEYFVLFILFSSGCAHFNSLFLSLYIPFSFPQKCSSIAITTIKNVNNINWMVIRGNVCIFTSHMFVAQSVYQIDIECYVRCLYSFYA